jgi:hypothetical protein
VSGTNREVLIADSPMKSVEKVIDTIRGRRGPATPPLDRSRSEAPEAPPAAPPAADIEDDVAQLHLAATVAAADADDA